MKLEIRNAGMFFDIKTSGTPPSRSRVIGDFGGYRFIGDSSHIGALNIRSFVEALGVCMSE